jgi:2-oxoacid:acceptor oxidoreductase delta subunit (pyruvate/2-ketoisovalerate family)
MAKAKKDKIKLEFAGVVSEPGSSLKNKTGSWRTLKPVVTSKCLGCGICANFCPDGAIKIVKKKMKIDYNYCKGCGICAVECPAKSIFMQKEEK